jgi:hypothetical protein
MALPIFCRLEVVELLALRREFFQLLAFVCEVVEPFAGRAQFGIVSVIAVAFELMVSSSGTFRARFGFEWIVIWAAVDSLFHRRVALPRRKAPLSLSLLRGVVPPGLSPRRLESVWFISAPRRDALLPVVVALAGGLASFSGPVSVLSLVRHISAV